MINLLNISDEDVIIKIKYHLEDTEENSEKWRILSSVLELTKFFSFINNRTYPRPDHPDPKKRKPLSFMMVAILVSLRTTLENEQKAVNNLIDKFPTEKELFLASEEEIEECIIPAGMASTKSKRIRKALDYVTENFQGNLESLKKYELEVAREKVLAIPGFGPKASDCLLSIGLEFPTTAIDVNVFRTVSWIFNLSWADSPKYNDSKQVSQVKEIIDRNIFEDYFICQIVHTYFLLFAKSNGSKHKKNGECLLSAYCLKCQSETQTVQYELF